MKSAAFATLVALFLAIAGVIAQDSTPFYITNPTSASQFKAGETVTLSWANGIDEEITVRLREGADANALGDTGVSFTIPDGSVGSYEWTVPTTLVTGSTYALEFVSAADGTIYNYSARFTINSGSVAASSSAALPSSSVAASSSASSVASSASSPAASSASTRPSASKTQSATETVTPEGSAASLGLTAFAVLAPALIAGVLAA